MTPCDGGQYSLTLELGRGKVPCRAYFKVFHLWGECEKEKPEFNDFAFPRSL